MRARRLLSLVCVCTLLALGCRPKSEGRSLGTPDSRSVDGSTSQAEAYASDDAGSSYDAGFSSGAGRFMDVGARQSEEDSGSEVIAVPECASELDCQGNSLAACQAYSCISGECVPVAVKDGLSCEDGDACTQNDQCTAGECIGELRVCQDSNPCTNDSCEAGECLHQPNANPCDDLDSCTGEDQCSEGSCTGTPLDCDDDEVCTEDVCEEGGCLNKPADEVCDDGDLCTLDDACLEGSCQGTAKPCTDGNPCTTDSCLDGDCVYSDNELSCDDSEPCTHSDKCSEGVCGGIAYICDEPGPCAALGGATCNGDGSCTYIADGSKDGVDCDDQDPCTEKDKCSDELCEGEAVICDDGKECTLDSCDPDDGSCRFEALPLEGEVCDDGQPCTEKDSCVSGSCEGVQYFCDDPGACRTAVGAICLGNGDCEYLSDSGLDGSVCDDGVECTHTDLCQSGVCVGEIYECDSPESCRTVLGASCNGDGTCNYPADSAKDGVLCDDQDPCTFQDLCTAGVCGGDEYTCTSPGQCRTVDGAICKGDGTCAYLPDSGQDGVDCDDGLPCTHTDLCDGGSCEGTNYECDSPEQCRTSIGASCNGDGSCDYPADSSQDSQGCEDGSLCTHTDICLSGSCEGTPYECDSPEACRTTEGALCLGDATCSYPADPGLNNLSCNDGASCTYDDACLDGVCEGVSYTCSNPPQCRGAEGAVCNGDGTCDYPADSTQDGESCDDQQPCTQTDLCSDGECSGSSYECTSPTQCRTSAGAVCNGDGGCDYPADATQDGDNCNDGVACTHSDLCDGGVCDGTLYECTSPEQCRTALDAQCDGLGDCSYPADFGQDGEACQDEDPCTVGDVCSSGMCSGEPKDCTDDNPCTVDQCDEDNGDCLFNAADANGFSCSDSDPCSLDDSCEAGDCVPKSYDCLNGDCSDHIECTPIEAGPGDLVITEIMGNPEGSSGDVDDALGEWFEVFNPSVRTRIFSGGTLVTQTGGADYGLEVVDGVVIPGQSYFVFGRSVDMTQNGGASVDYSYSGLPLNNTDEATVRILLVAPNSGWDTLTAPTEEMVVDEVVVPEGVFLASEGGAGLSWQLGRLDASFPSASANDKSYNWCYVQDIPNYQMSGGDFATPNSENAVCIKETNCDDGLDDDEDGLVDCEDIDCVERTACLPPESACGDTLDNDNDDLVDCDDPSCDESPVCVNPKATAGSLLITEVMGNPSSVSDNNGEWFEIWNPGTTPIVIQNGVIATQGSTGAFKSHLISEPIVLDSGSYFVWGRSIDLATNGGAPVDAAYGSLSIVNSGQARIVLIAPEANWDGESEPESSMIVDEVVTGSGSFASSKAGRSLQLKPGTTSAIENDLESNWCHTPTESDYVYGLGDYGTPGAVNFSCE